MKTSFLATLIGVLFSFSACLSHSSFTENSSEISAEKLQLPSPKAGRTKPLVAVIADNAGTETTDFILPYGILKESKTADVITISTQPGVIHMMPSLKITTDTTIKNFDKTEPSGADIVIVPAMHDNKNKRLIDWVKSQANKGAVVISICEGAWILAHAGLLDGKKATTHWYALNKIARDFPSTRWKKNQRYVVDGNIVTTAGVTASIPASLALIESIAGHEAANETAQKLKIVSWGTEHDSEKFEITARQIFLVIKNWVAFWKYENINIPVEDGVDEMTLALTADSWSRTYRSKAFAINRDSTVVSKNGLRFVTESRAKSDAHKITLFPVAPAQALVISLQDISRRYGNTTADFVAVQLEYPFF